MATTRTSMSVDEIREKARSLGINTEGIRLAQTIRDIQLSEGQKPCFERSGGQCDVTDCAYMELCLGVEEAETEQPQDEVDS